MLTVILDGDNVLRALKILRGSHSAPVEIFLQRLEMAAAARDWEIIVVFDGPERFLLRESGLLRVLYAAGKTADTVIERLVYESPNRAQVVVVTRDRDEGNLVLGLGARVWTPQRLLEEVASE